MTNDAKLSWTMGRVRAHWHWARTQGVARLIEEDQLNPFDRFATRRSKRRWRRAHAVSPGSSTPVFLVGAQRSGTNMVVRGLESSPEFEVRNENDKAAFDRFRLRSDTVVRNLVMHSPHRYVLFKPLCDSSRTAELLDTLGTPRPGLALWVYRNVDGRARSALAKFGDANLQFLRAFAAGHSASAWQAEGISADTRRRILEINWGTANPETAAAMFWYLRNRLFFEQSLDARDDVALVSYDSLLAAPESTVRALCDFLDFPYTPRLVEHIEVRPPAFSAPLAVDDRVRAWCDELSADLEAVTMVRQETA